MKKMVAGIFHQGSFLIMKNPLIYLTSLKLLQFRLKNSNNSLSLMKPVINCNEDLMLSPYMLASRRPRGNGNTGLVAILGKGLLRASWHKTREQFWFFRGNSLFPKKSDEKHNLWHAIFVRWVSSRAWLKFAAFPIFSFLFVRFRFCFCFLDEV